MIYSVRGNFVTTQAGAEIMTVVNQYQQYKTPTQSQYVDEQDRDIFSFEAWITSLSDKTALFEELKLFVDQYGEWIDWHECSHDESVSRPCVISETYNKVV